MKTKLLKLLIITLTLGLSSCSNDDNQDISNPAPESLSLTFNVETNQDQMGDFSHNEMVVYNDIIWSVAGYNSYHTSIHSDVWKSANGSAWVSHSSDQFPKRKGHSLTVYDDKMWLIGGYTETTPDTFSALNDVWYSTDGDIWTLVTEEALGIPSIGNHSTVVFNNKLYIIKDGENELAPGSTVWSSTDGSTWTRQTDNAFSHREGFDAVVFNNEIYVTGGMHESTYYNEIWKSSDGINWTEVTTSGDIFFPRANGETVVYNNKLWVFGGTNGSTSTGLGLYYSNNGEQWNRYEPLPSEDGLQHFSALNYNNAIWVFGGMHQEEGTSSVSRVGTINTIKQE